MNWAKERDLLISQTMAFVQSVGVPAREPEVRAKGRLELVPVEQAPAARSPAKVDPVELRSDLLQMNSPLPLPRIGMREEIQGRVAAFRAHQQLFHRERDAYFHAVLDKARDTASKPPNFRGS